MTALLKSIADLQVENTKVKETHESEMKVRACCFRKIWQNVGDYSKEIKVAAKRDSINARKCLKAKSKSFRGSA